MWPRVASHFVSGRPGRAGVAPPLPWVAAFRQPQRWKTGAQVALPLLGIAARWRHLVQSWVASVGGQRRRWWGGGGGRGAFSCSKADGADAIYGGEWRRGSAPNQSALLWPRESAPRPGEVVAGDGYQTVTCDSATCDALCYPSGRLRPVFCLI